jgi:hypothetical protein
VSAFWAAIASGALRGKEPERKGWKITLRDDSLPHQIRISLMPGGSGLIAVSCNCLRVPVPGTPKYEPIEARTRWEPDEPIELWRKHMAEVDAA